MICTRLLEAFNTGKQQQQHKTCFMTVFRDNQSKKHFYGTTLCVSVVFAVAQCLSICLSVTFMHSIQTAEDIVKLLCRPGSPITSFLTPSAGTQFQGEPLQCGCKI